MNELTMNLKVHSGTPLYEQIYEYIKNDIQRGKIRYGEKLPSTRALARHLEISRSTVELAYEQLLSEGYIESEPYKGYYVAQIDELYHISAAKEKVLPQKEYQESYRYDFTPNGVDLKSFPYNTWRKLSKDVLIDDKMELFRSGDPKGEYGFRKAICSYIYQARGVNCIPEQVIVGAGSDYVLMLLGTILEREYTVAFENPTYMQAYKVFGSMGYHTVSVPVDQSGMQVDELAKSNAQIAYVTPSHQYPTGIVMPIKRRMELLRWANDAENRYIIEDDYDSEFRYKGKPIPALQGYDRTDKVIYLGTFSKSIAPAIRMSYVVLPDTLLEKYEEQFHFINSTVSKVDQMIVQRFIEDGYYERHLNKTRAMYKARHDILLEELRPLMDICTISGEHAGVHILLKFHNGMTEEELITRAKEKEIHVYGMSDYLVSTRTSEPVILLGYANISENQIREAVRILCSCWR